MPGTSYEVEVHDYNNSAQETCVSFTLFDVNDLVSLLNIIEKENTFRASTDTPEVALYVVPRFN